MKYKPFLLVLPSVIPHLANHLNIMEQAMKNIHTYYKLRIRLLARRDASLRADGLNVLVGEARIPLLRVPRFLMNDMIEAKSAATEVDVLSAVRGVFPEAVEDGLADRLLQEMTIEGMGNHPWVARMEYKPFDGTLFEWWISDDGKKTKVAGDISGIMYAFTKTHYRFYCASYDIQRMLSCLAWDARIGPLDAAAIMCTLAFINGHASTHEDVSKDVVKYIHIARGVVPVDAPLPSNVDGYKFSFAHCYRTGAAKIIQRTWRQWRLHTAAANTIKFSWKRAISDPSYTVCKKRLRSEFGDGTIL